MFRAFPLLVLLLAPAGCKKDEPGQPGGQAQAGAPAETAKPAAAEPAPARPATGNEAAKPANPMEALAQLAKAGEALSKGMGQKELGPVVSWRDLQPFAPDKIGDHAAEGELDGSTGSMGAMKVSSVKRRYKAGESELRLEISDTSMVPMLRAGFAMAAHVQEDSTRGIKKGVTVEGQPGLLEWRKAGKRGKLALLVGGRFIVNLRLRPTDDPEAVVKLAKQIDLKKLAELKGKE